MSTFTKQLIHTAAIALIAAACTQTDDDTPQGRAISFRPAAETRAAVEKGGTPADFLVWGGYGATHLLFDGETVHSPGWNYDGGTRYWVPGNWNFHAIHPKAALDGKVAFDNGTFTVTGFDASATGTEAVDLMTATASEEYTEEENPPTSVGLAFHHELARVNVVIKTENTVATVNAFKIYGVDYKGKLTKGTTTQWSKITTCTAEETPFKLATPFTFNTTNGFEKSMLGDLLLIPDTDLTGAGIDIAYHYEGETADRTSTVSLKTSTTTRWEAGKRYNYTLTIKGGTLTINVTVADWKEEDTSVSWG